MVPLYASQYDSDSVASENQPLSFKISDFRYFYIGGFRRGRGDDSVVRNGKSKTPMITKSLKKTCYLILHECFATMVKVATGPEKIPQGRGKVREF